MGDNAVDGSEPADTSQVRVQVRAILDFLGDRVLESQVDRGAFVTGVAAVTPGRKGCLSFSGLRFGDDTQHLSASRSSLILVRAGVGQTLTEPGHAFIAVDEPRREFARVVQALFAIPLPGVVSPAAVIEEGATLGSNVDVAGGAFIAADVVIGDDSRVGANAVLLAGTVVGDNTTIGPNCTIGYAGFGYAREADGTPVHVPHLGGVRIGSNVEIGANTCIDRGTIDDTVVEDDVKIDNLVHIAHNCQIQQGAFVIATAVICGGVRIGPRAWVAPNVSVREQLVVGADAVIGLAATVVKDVPAATTVIGSPAREVPR